MYVPVFAEVTDGEVQDPSSFSTAQMYFYPLTLMVDIDLLYLNMPNKKDKWKTTEKLITSIIN